MKNSDKDIKKDIYNLDDIVKTNRDSYKNKYVVIKYGGSAMKNNELTEAVITDVCYLFEAGVLPVLVHGGGPFIKQILEKVGLTSEFVDGHRITTPDAMKYVEMALKGEVNGRLVKSINQYSKAVGISGKDGKMVVAEKRLYSKMINGKWQKVDLGLVGNVKSVDTKLIIQLLENGYIPVIASIGAGEEEFDYNINADMFAGHIAGALNAAVYITMTDVDGLMKKKDDPNSFISRICVNELDAMQENIQSGMIPKIESCKIALEQGVKSARIINGTKKHTIIRELFTREREGTLLFKD